MNDLTKVNWVIAVAILAVTLIITMPNFDFVTPTLKSVRGFVLNHRVVVKHLDGRDEISVEGF